MAVNGDVERMTSSDLELTSQTETEDTDTGDLEESGTTFSSSDGNESSFTSVSSSCSSKISKDSQNIDMKSVSSADGSTSTGDTEQSDTDKSDVIFKYPSVPKVSYDLTEVSELSNFENLSNYERKFSSHSLRDDKRKDVNDRKTHQFPDFMSLQGDWFKHPCFKRYWDHYSSVMGWCNKHYQVYNSVVKTDTKTSMPRQFQDTQQISNMLSWQQYYLNSYYGGSNVQNGNRTMDRRSNGSAKKKTVKKRKRRRSVRSRSSKGEGPEGKHDDDDDDEQFEMEITDGMMEFFKQSEEHRRAREEEKQASIEAGGQEEEHVNIEEVKVTAQKGPTTEAPKDRPGAKRTSEMKLLYGKGAPMIHGMETALQMTFDRNLDVKQPKLWPNMPLKLVFG